MLIRVVNFPKRHSKFRFSTIYILYCILDLLTWKSSDCFDYIKDTKVYPETLSTPSAATQMSTFFRFQWLHLQWHQNNNWKIRKTNPPNPSTNTVASPFWCCNYDQTLMINERILATFPKLVSDQFIHLRLCMLSLTSFWKRHHVVCNGYIAVDTWNNGICSGYPGIGHLLH